ncbi:MAG: A/G-specific adenine glycosylase [Planctomycetaceae bacterium]
MSAYPKHTDLGWRRRLRSRILKWYDQHGRKLPWRESADPYQIWVSEIMLQQTTVAAVVPYFERFIRQFPSVRHLAAANQDQVLRMWEGLGYYSRARNLHKSAQMIVAERDGCFPQSVEELQQLPGIGSYTAGAISSFAFNLPAPIVEANTLRLYSRLIELTIDPRSTAGQKTLWKFAAWIVSRKRAADFNQAAMDIGSQVCTPKDPDCRRCPLMASCKAFEAGRQNQIPSAAAKQPITDMVEISIAVHKGNRFLLRQRTAGERWEGLWDFLRFEITADEAAQIQIPQESRGRTNMLPGQQSLFADDEPSPSLPRRIAATAEQQTGLMLTTYDPIAEIRHAVTRYRIRLLCTRSEPAAGRLRAGSGFRWFSADQLQKLPLSKTGRQLADRLIG